MLTIEKYGVTYPIYKYIYDFLYHACKSDRKSGYKSLIGVTKMY